MKHLFTCLVALLAGTAAATAEDWHITVNVTGADLIKEAFITSSFNSGERTPVTFQEGANPLTIPEDNDLYFNVNDGVVSTLTDGDGDAMTLDWRGYYDIYRGWGAEDNAVYTFSAMPESEYRTASVTINMDTPDRVKINRADGTTFKPTESPLVLAYNPDKESKLVISPRNWGEGLYKVMAGDTEIKPNDGDYVVNLVSKDGETTKYIETIDVTASYPADFAYNAKINLDGPTSAIASVTVGGQTVEDFMSTDGFSVKPETRLVITFDTNNYAIDSFKENGETKTLYSNSWSISSVKSDYVFSIKAHELKELSTTINAVCAEAFNVKVLDKTFDLKEGANPITVKEGKYQISIKGKTGYDVIKLEYGGQDLLKTEDWKYYKEARITVEDGKEINIEGAPIVRDKQFALFVKNLNLASSWSRYVEFYTSTSRYEHPEDLVEGYNIIPFRPADGLAMIYFGGTYDIAPKAYINDESLPVLSGPYHVEYDVVDGDVIKVFLGGEPEIHTVTFTLGDNVEPSSIKVLKDVLTTVDPTSAVTATGQTQFSVAAADDTLTGLTVKVGKTAVAPNADGKFVFELDSDATVSVTAASSGIEAIEGDANATVNVYNLQGILVLENADSNAISALPAGIYIAGGKKIVVR